MIEANKSVMIIGSGRLAYRLRKFFEKNSTKVIYIDSKEFREVEETRIQESSMDYARELLIKKGIADVSAVCVVDGDDGVNLYLLIATLAAQENVLIYATFFNENLVSQIKVKHSNVKIFNPAVIVSRVFAGVVPSSMPEKENTADLNTYNDSPRDKLISGLVFGFLFLLLSGAYFFHLTEGVDWQKSFYLVITVITSVNFNDAELTNYNQGVYNMRMGLMLATYAYVIGALAFIIDQIVKHRTDVLIFGRKRYHNNNHIIVCGLGRVGYAIVQELLETGEDVLVIESDLNNKYLPAVRATKTPILVGDATLAHYLVDAGIGRARALISAIDSDTDNLVIGTNARSINNKIRLLLRIYDQSTAEEIKKKLNIHYAFSKSFATAQVIYNSIMCRWECAEIKKKEVQTQNSDFKI